MGILDLDKVRSQQQGRDARLAQKAQLLPYTQQCNRELWAYAADALEEFAQAATALSTKPRELDVVYHRGFRNRLKTRQVSAYAFGRLGEETFSYKLPAELERNLDRFIGRATTEFPTGYVDAQGNAYMECSCNYGIYEKKLAWVQVERDSAVEFLFKALCLPPAVDPKDGKDEIRAKFEQAKQTIKEHLEKMLV